MWPLVYKFALQIAAIAMADDNSGIHHWCVCKDRLPDLMKVSFVRVKSLLVSVVKDETVLPCSCRFRWCFLYFWHSDRMGIAVGFVLIH